MFEKIKTIFSIIGAVLTVILLTVILFLLRRSKALGQGGGADSDRADGIEERIGECEERLQGAENILREAIRRSREQEQKA